LITNQRVTNGVRLTLRDLLRANALGADGRGDRGARKHGAHCHAGLARLVERGAKPGEARRYRATATTMYGEMGMTYWLEEAAEG